MICRYVTPSALPCGGSAVVFQIGGGGDFLYRCSQDWPALRQLPRPRRLLHARSGLISVPLSPYLRRTCFHASCRASLVVSPPRRRESYRYGDSFHSVTPLFIAARTKSLSAQFPLRAAPVRWRGRRLAASRIPCPAECANGVPAILFIAPALAGGRRTAMRTSPAPSRNSAIAIWLG
ncbi:hypothetical protein KCP70_22615 [Salmonella enterica subsp. enterica]|nr:hypothetical protein KCP70_22615 [Salmonella enterica subsp. enterica]